MTALYTPERAEEASDRLDEEFLAVKSVPIEVNNFMTAVGPFVLEVLSSDSQQLPKEWKVRMLVLFGICYNDRVS